MTFTVKEAQKYLMANPHRQLRVKIAGGLNRTIFYNSDLRLFGMHFPKCSRRGHSFDWSSILRIFAPETNCKSLEERRAALIAKYKAKAAKATFTNEFIRKIAAADPTKSVYENNLSTGVPIEGKIISLKSIGRKYPYTERMFRDALANRRNYISPRMPFRGYEMSLEINNDSNGDVRGFLSLEYKDCCNGYYYLLVNDDEFIGYDID